MIVSRIGHADAVQRHLTTKASNNGAPCIVDHLTATLPVVDDELTIVIAADHIDGSGDVQVHIIDGPLLTIRTDVVVPDEAHEMLTFGLHTDLFALALVTEYVTGFEASVLKIVLRLFMQEGTHLAGHAADTIPFAECLFGRNTIALLTTKGSTLSIERFEEIAYEVADR